MIRRLITQFFDLADELLDDFQHDENEDSIIPCSMVLCPSCTSAISPIPHATDVYSGTVCASYETACPVCETVFLIHIEHDSRTIAGTSIPLKPADEEGCDVAPEGYKLHTKPTHEGHSFRGFVQNFSAVTVANYLFAPHGPFCPDCGNTVQRPRAASSKVSARCTHCGWYTRSES